MKIFGILLLSALATNGANYYIAQTAAGAGDASSCANAKASSWNWLSPNVADGDTIHLCGTFTSQLSAKISGSSVGITLLFEAGAKFSAPVFGATGAIYVPSKNYITIDGGGNGLIENTSNGDGLATQNVSSGIYVDRADHLEIKNLTISNIYVHTQNSSVGASPDSYGVVIDGSTNLLAHNNIIHDVKSGFFRLATFSGSNLSFYTNTTYNTNWGFGITVGGAGIVLDSINVYNNDISMGNAWDDMTNGNHHNGLYAFTDASGAGQITNLAFYGNICHGAPGEVWTSTACFFTEYGVPSPKIYNNLFIGVLGDPANGYINLQTGTAASSPLIANNTFLGTHNATYGAITPRCITFANNTATTGTIQNNLCSTVAQGIASNSGSSFTSDYDNIYNVTYYGAVNGTNYSAWSGGGSWQAAGFDVHGINSNPMLTTAYALGAGSPAIGAGTNLTSLGITALNSDKNGIPRPSSGAWDIGAYQYVSGGGSSLGGNLTLGGSSVHN